MDASITYKTFHLLNALNLDGVMCALVNVVLHSFSSQCYEEFDMTEFERFLKELKKDSDHTDNRFMYIHSCAHDLSRLAIMSKDFKLPREAAKRIIKDAHYGRPELYSQFDQRRIWKAEKEFTDWTDQWMKDRNQDQNFKIKLLFMRLLRTDKRDNHLHYANVNLSLRK